jgi:glycosyltransferase involved in cell wall biosynthesis
MQTRHRKRLAVFSVGGIGMGAFSEGLPTMRQIVERLAERFEVTYYSLLPTDPSFAPRGYALRAPSAWEARTHLKGALWLSLSKRFLVDHRRAPYDSFLSFWGYPMGTFVAGLSRVHRRPAAAIFMGAELASVPAIGYGVLRSAPGRAVVRATCASLGAVVVQSGWQRAALRTLGARQDNVHHVPWGADARTFTFERKALARPLKIVHVANLNAIKDQATLVRAFALLRSRMEAKLRVVGGDFMNGTVHSLAERLGLSNDVEFTGPVRFAEVPGHYQWADMFVLTSLSEGQNSALTEAISCGLLAVSTRVGLAADLGDDGAVLVDRRNPGELAAKIQDVANDPAGWRRRVERAHSWATSHTLEWTVDRLTDVLTTLPTSHAK